MLAEVSSLPVKIKNARFAQKKIGGCGQCSLHYCEHCHSPNDWQRWQEIKATRRKLGDLSSTV
jgi:hypothetical protein